MLKKEIGFKTLLFLAINGILGTGIFFLPAIGAGVAGPASIISWLIMSLVAIGIAFYFAELSSMFPKSGGTYEFAKQAFSGVTAFIVGWTSWIVANITIAMLLVGSFRYLLPGMSDLEILFISVLTIILLNFISYRGIGLSSSLLLIFGVLTVGTLLALLIPGLFSIQLTNFTPFFVSEPFTIFLAVFFIAETFFGWETLTYLSEEVRNPKDIPKVMILGTSAVILISLGLVFVSLGNIHWEVFSVSRAPLALLSTTLFGEFGKYFGLFIFIPLIGTAATWIISSPRLLYAMSRDRVFLTAFEKVHSHHATPHLAIAFQTIITIFVTFLALGSYNVLLSLLLPLILLVYSMTLLAVVKLRITRPNAKRFRAPLGKVGPLIIVLFNLSLIFVWVDLVPGSIRLLLLSVLLVLIGFPAYVLIRLETSAKSTERFFDKFSPVWDKAFPIWYGKRELHRVIKNAGIKNGDIVLDYGCATGYTTEALAKAVGPKGKVFAVDISKEQLKRAVRRIQKDIFLPNVIFVKTSGRNPFQPNTFDVVTLVGVIDHFRNPLVQLRKIVSCLKKEGRLSAMAFGKALGVPPGNYLSSKESIKRLFAKAGLRVKVSRQYRRGCEYWFIWGKK